MEESTGPEFADEPAEVRVLDGEIIYLLDVYNYYFPSHDKTIVEEMAGYRVLPAEGKNLFKRFRKTVLTFDKKRSRAVAIIGEKLTVYRKTASIVMKLLGPALPRRNEVARTHRIKLSPQDRL